MIRYIVLALFFSGLLSLEASGCSHPRASAFIPDAGLLIVLLYGIRGQGRAVVPLSFLLGLLKGGITSDPAGFYILVYLLLGFFLLGTRQLLFIDHPLTQIVLALLTSLLFWSALAGGLAMGWLSESLHQDSGTRLYTCLSTVLFTPPAAFLYGCMTAVKRRLRP